MKTSNKILSTAFAAYLLFTAGNSAAILKEYKRAEASGKALITQLEKTSIHVLSVEGDNYIQASRGRKSSQTLGFWSPFDPETTPLRICGDTLYISGTSYGLRHTTRPEKFPAQRQATTDQRRLDTKKPVVYTTRPVF